MKTKFKLKSVSLILGRWHLIPTLDVVGHVSINKHYWCFLCLQVHWTETPNVK